VENIAVAGGAEADVTIELGYPVTMNDPELTASMLPTLQWAAGAEQVSLAPAKLGAEDFSYFAEKCPGLYISLGVTPPALDLSAAAPNHSPLFVADEAALPVGVRALAGLAVDYMLLHAD
jgi:amidohydrolase